MLCFIHVLSDDFHIPESTGALCCCPGRGAAASLRFQAALPSTKAALHLKMPVPEDHFSKILQGIQSKIHPGMWQSENQFNLSLWLLQ